MLGCGAGSFCLNRGGSTLGGQARVVICDTIRATDRPVFQGAGTCGSWGRALSLGLDLNALTLRSAVIGVAAQRQEGVAWPGTKAS